MPGRRRSRLGLGLGAALLGLGLVRARETARLARRRERLREPPKRSERPDPGVLADLPTPARRYLRHAVAWDRPLARTVTLEMSGTFRTAPDAQWRHVDAREVLTWPEGFLWEARLSLGALGWIRGADYFLDGTGGQRFFLWDLLPVLWTSGPAVDRSAAGRFLAETVWLPSALLPGPGVSWEGVDDERARVHLAAGDHETTLTLTIAADGALRQVDLERFRGDGSGRAPFRVRVGDEGTVDGYAVPTEIRAAWGDGEFEPFLRARVTDARLR